MPIIMAKTKSSDVEEEEEQEQENLNEDPNTVSFGGGRDQELVTQEAEERLEQEQEAETEEEEDEEEKEYKGEKQKHAVVLTGGIDSTVLLYHLKKTLPNVTIIPISVGDHKYINHNLSELKIKAPSSKISLPTDMVKAKDKEWGKVFQKLADSDIAVIHFAANYDEALNSIEDKNFPLYQRLDGIARKHKVAVSTPFSGVTKESIIQMAVDDYNIDLAKLAPPKKSKGKDDKTAKAIEDIRKKSFNKIYSQRYARLIDDPFGEPKKAKESEGG